MCFSPSLPPIILLHFVCQLWKAFYQFCVPEAKTSLFPHSHLNNDGRHTVDLIGFCEFIIVITEHSGSQNLIPQCIVQRLNCCPFGQCERWCNGNERSQENGGDKGKCWLEFIPGILMPLWQWDATYGSTERFIQVQVQHMYPYSWATSLSGFLPLSSLTLLHPLETQRMCMDIREWEQSAESEGRRGHSGTAMCSECLSNHPASWISKQAECWAAFNIPLPSKRKKPQRSILNRPW